MDATQTLRDLRKRDDTPITEIIDRAKPIDPDFPKTHAGYLGIEENGTRDHWKITALAHVFDVKVERMAEIVKPKNKVANSDILSCV